MAPMQVSMRASAATLAVLGLLAASFAGGASGAGSPNVAALQVGLRTHGLYQGTVDGVLGPRTERAVMRFQRRAGLSPDGVIGARTRKAFGRYGRRGPLGRRDLAIGTRGWDVAALQFALAWHGFPSAVFDGVLGAHTDTALRKFQRWAGLDPDGTAGPSTYAALRRPVPRSPIKLSGSGRRCVRRPVRAARQSLPRGHRHPGLQGHARRRRRCRASRLRGSRRGVRQARRARACTRRQDPLRAPVADRRSRRPVREGPRHRRPRGCDGRGDRPAPALRGAGPRRQRRSIVRPLTRGQWQRPRRKPRASPIKWSCARGSRRDKIRPLMATPAA